MKNLFIHVYNHYKSVKLSNSLLTQQMHTTITSGNNQKGNSKIAMDRKLKKGEHTWKRTNCIFVSKWKDKLDVLCITTKVQPKSIQLKNRLDHRINKLLEIVGNSSFIST